MKRIEIEVLRPGAALNAFSNTWQELAAGKDVIPRLAFGSLRELFSAITPKRLEIIRSVAAHEALNTRQLAGITGRDYKNVYTDVSALLALGLLDKDAKGRLSAPFDELVIHAPLRDAA